MATPKEGARPLSTAGCAYLTAVISCGIAAVVSSVIRLHFEPLGYQWFLLAALTFISGSATVTLPSVPASISVSETFVFASVLLFGSAAGTVMVALDGLVISFWMAKRRPEWYRALFNMAAPALSIWCASHLLFIAAGIQPLINQPATVNVLLLPLVLFALVYFGMNSWFIALAVAFETRLHPYRVWRENFLWLSLNYFSGASVALLMVVYTRAVDLRFIGVIIPLLLVLYATYKNSMDRVEDANRHLEQVNRLHLSTIETLAMAIDAKDQITHGHIRRVQTLAVGLAERVGVTDQQLIRAIEAAALLHDMGKLAVPEYILNKPGKLTAAEFDKMKLHAAVGADILSAIDFPYPVVPIVRHHHENWDGSGYPAGLKSTDIPIGARILSVVDCFDALTSDRPYRPRLPDAEAIKILVQRRGSMYDPLVVDTFIDNYQHLTPQHREETISSNTLDEITNATLAQHLTAPQLDRIGASSNEMLTLYDLAKSLNHTATIEELYEAIATHLRRLVPVALCVFFVYNPGIDELEAAYVVGEPSWIVRGLRIPLGQRLSGWVAANRKTIVNSDPILDLGDVSRTTEPRLRSCLSTPLVALEELVGVLSVYAVAGDAFTDNHRHVIEAIANQAAIALKPHISATSSQFSVNHSTDSVTGLRDVRQLEQAIASISGLDRGGAFLVVANVVGLDDIGSRFGKTTYDDFMRRAGSSLKSCLGSSKMLFRSHSNGFAVLLIDSNDREVAALSDQMRQALEHQSTSLIAEQHISVRIGIAVVPVTSDGANITSLLRQAKASPSDERKNATIH